MKKLFIIVIVCILLSNCSINQNNIDNRDATLEQTDHISFTLEEGKSLEDTIADCSMIIKGIVKDIRSGEYDSTLLDISITSVLKGSFDNSNITVTTYDELTSIHKDNEIMQFYETGNEYVFLLNKKEFIFYGNVYTPSQGFCIKTVGDQIDKIYQQGYEYTEMRIETVEDLNTLVKNKVNDVNLNTNIDGWSYLDSETAKDIAENSTIIVRAIMAEDISPVSVIESDIAVVRIKVTQNLKGDLPENAEVYVFKKDVIIGNEYLLFLSPPNDKNQSGRYCISSKASCILIYSIQYDEYMQYVKP